jgi:hypothetical protein
MTIPLPSTLITLPVSRSLQPNRRTCTLPKNAHQRARSLPRTPMRRTLLTHHILTGFLRLPQTIEVTLRQQPQDFCTVR